MTKLLSTIIAAVFAVASANVLAASHAGAQGDKKGDKMEKKADKAEKKEAVAKEEPVARVAIPETIDDAYMAKLGLPGQYPFTRGVQPTM